MNILYLCHRIPYPPDKGDKIRSFHHLEHLAREHRVHLACLIDAPEDRAHVAALARWCASVDTAWRGKTLAGARAALALVAGGSLSVAAFRSEDLKRKVQRRLVSDPCDVAIVFSSSMGQYLPRNVEIPTILDYVDLDSEKWRTYADFKRWPTSSIYRSEGRRLRRYEEALAQRCQRAVFVSDAEADLFRRMASGIDTRVIPNGVDTGYFHRADGQESSPSLIVFLGLMDYFPNVDAVTYFAHHVFPLVRKGIPDAVFRVVGRNPTKEVQALARLAGVEVTGAVADVRPHLAAAAVTVAPFRIARGIQNKILESMAMGTPVVGTRVAFQGIAAREEDGVRLGDDPAALAREISSFLLDSNLRDACARRAKHFVERHHSWNESGRAMVRLMDEVVERPSEASHRDVMR